MYTTSVGDKICLMLAEGRSLNAICKDEDMPARSSVMKWALDLDHEFSCKYTKAREIQAECMADDIMDIADNGSNDYMEREEGEVIYNGDHIQRSRLRVDSRKWYLSRIVPRFKDKQEVDNNISGNLSVTVPAQLTEQEFIDNLEEVVG